MKKYPVTNFDLESIKYGGFELIEIKKGWLDKRTVISEPHRHEFHEIIFIFKGNDIHSVDFNEYLLNERDVLIIPKGSIHDFIPSDKSHGWKLIFDDSFFNDVQQMLFKDFQIFIPFYGRKSIRISTDDLHIMEYSIEIISKLKSNRQRKIVLLNFISFLNDYFEEYLENIDRNFVFFLKLLDKKIHEHHNVNFYAETLNISGKSLNNLVKEVTGCSTIEYIHTRLVNEAKRKLLYTKMNINEIAYSIGFKDALYFSRFFKKMTQSSPSQFREKVSKMF